MLFWDLSLSNRIVFGEFRGLCSLLSVQHTFEFSQEL